VKEAVRSKISIHKRVGEKFPDDLLLSLRYLGACPMVLIYHRRPRERIRHYEHRGDQLRGGFQM